MKPNFIDLIGLSEFLKKCKELFYIKPSTGIPASDLASGVIPDVSNFITNSVNDLVNYYLKSETYTQTEVQSLIGAIQSFHYEIAASTSDVTNPQSNVLYLIGPSGTGLDQYEEYVYPDSTTGWTKIGDTSVDLTQYALLTDLVVVKGTGANSAVQITQYTSQATGANSHAEGGYNNAIGQYSHAEGWANFARGYCSHAEGIGTSTGASAQHAHTEGSYTEANNNSEHAEGYWNKSNQKTTGTDAEKAAGSTLKSIGIGANGARKNAFEIMHNGDAYLLGIGNYDGTNLETDVNNPSQTLQNVINSLPKTSDLAVVKGTGTGSVINPQGGSTASGEGAFAFGTLSGASGNNSFAHGYQAKASGPNTTAEGSSQATAESAHAEGSNTKAQGRWSHTEGQGTNTLADGGHAEGGYTLAQNKNEHAEGSYNKSNQKTTGTDAEKGAGSTQHSIGIGTADNARKNAFEVMQNGDAYLYGVGGYDGTNPATSGVNSLQDIIKLLTPPVVEFTPFDPGDVTDLATLYTKIKINGENITSLDDLVALKGRVFWGKTANAGQLLMPQRVNIDTNRVEILCGYDFSGGDFESEELISVLIDIDALSDSSIYFYEI